jgi:hypothetical protein
VGIRLLKAEFLEFGVRCFWHKLSKFLGLDIGRTTIITIYMRTSHFLNVPVLDLRGQV